jgi:membrane-associated phospholipid phosphatase
MGVYLALVSLAATDSREHLPRSLHFPSSVAAYPLPVRALWAICSLGLAGAVVWSRVRLGYHSLAQVLVGSFLGALTAIIAFLLWFGDDRWTGLSIYAPRLEAALEDACWIALEAWQQGDPIVLIRTLLDTDWKVVMVPDGSL